MNPRLVHRSAMQWPRLLLLLIFACFAGHDLRADSISSPPTGRIIKVLSLLMDTNGAVATSPSLFDRDAYQALLLEHTNDVSGIRFDVCWKARHARGVKLKVRVELRGVAPNGLPTEAVLEQTVTPKTFHRWISLTLAGGDYKKLGTLAAWRATLWNGQRKLSEQKSFLWSF
ncbi:MAG TPA: hypothetical protein VME24_12700 [Alphaproteobacteria bacterium]|nr:hypothetical protein [Alphaproteobacteria bacterium]